MSPFLLSQKVCHVFVRANKIRSTKERYIIRLLASARGTKQIESVKTESEKRESVRKSNTKAAMDLGNGGDIENGRR